MPLFALSFSGTIPDSIASLSSLRFLALDNNHLIRTIPPKMATLPALTSLYINDNNLIRQLEFSEEFCQGWEEGSPPGTMRTFASPVGTAAGGDNPYGVVQCKQQHVTANYNSSSSKDNNEYHGNPNQSLVGFPASPVAGFL